MARPPKTLVELIRGNGFCRDRHAALLESESLPEEAPEFCPRELWRKLRWAQACYCEGLAKERAGATWSLALDYLDAFSRGVRALHGGRLPWLLGGPPYSR